MNTTKLSNEEILRYSRHFPVISLKGQEKLKQAKVICIGCGGLGSPALYYLAAAGVGTIGLVDDDVVEVSNLQRQILFTEKDQGKFKAQIAANRLSEQNPHITCVPYTTRLTESNAATLLREYDVVLDGSDNYQTRYILNDVCVLQHKPLISACINQFEGQCCTYNYQGGPCYRCIYPEPPPAELMPNCAVAGVLGVLPGILGSLQALCAIKLIIGLNNNSLSSQLLSFNALTLEFKNYQIAKNPDCELCHQGKLSTHLFQKSVQAKAHMSVLEITPQQLVKWLNDDSIILHLIDVRENYERKICHIGGEHIPSSEFNWDRLHLEKQSLIVFYCKSGGRSLKIANQLKDQGYQRVHSLQGGIMAWREQIDSTITLY